MEIKKATIDDIDIIIKNRVMFVSGFGEIMSPKQFEEITYNYLKTNIVNDMCICWYALDNEVLVSNAILCVYDVLPNLSNPHGKAGYMLNVWTHENYRKKGIATNLVKNIIDDAKRIGINKITLSATEQGKPVYEKLGFKLLSNEMALII